MRRARGGGVGSRQAMSQAACDSGCRRCAGAVRDALAAAKVLMETEKSAEEIAKKAIRVASEICVFTNDNINVQKI